MSEVPVSPDPGKALPQTRNSRLLAALQQYVSDTESNQGEFVAYFVGVAAVIHPEDGQPRYHVFYSDGLQTYTEAELAAVLEDHVAARRSKSFR